MTCQRCASETDLREICICAVVDATVCAECRSELQVHPGIKQGSVVLARAKRHAEIHKLALAGPGADVEACLRASDAVAGAEGALRETIRAWMAERPARGKN